jgi:hypothetical protein
MVSNLRPFEVEFSLGNGKKSLELRAMQKKLTWLSGHVLHGNSVLPNNPPLNLGVKCDGHARYSSYDSASYPYLFTWSYTTALVVYLYKLHRAVPMDLLHTEPTWTFPPEVTVWAV